MDELLLWRWSTAVQISSALIIAAFFVAYQRSLPQPALRLWTLAWVANALALLVTWAYWLLQPESRWALQLTTAVYLASKTGFVLLLVSGLRIFLGRDALILPSRRGALAVAVAAVACALALDRIDLFGCLQAALIAGVFGYGAWVCARHPGSGVGWLGFGLALRALLGLSEALAYGGRHLLSADATPEPLDLFLAAHSSFDTGAEWVIALGCVLALGQRVLAELSASHRELHAAHAELLRVAERDALTGLYNRRMLTRLLEGPGLAGGRLLFFDLDDFKRINDAHGHEAGDEGLRRFAAALTEIFPESPGVLRYAGDEFIVLLPADAAPDVDARLARLRAALDDVTPGRPAIAFSTGSVPIAGGTAPRELLHAADLAMYRDKRERARQATPG